ncbi:hypothetical protein AeMF1_004690 [Aphanomyces euteiches]|nr:hypothetical protein AeMF1_004690 [Aphanomyces euteiches]
MEKPLRFEIQAMASQEMMLLRCAQVGDVAGLRDLLADDTNLNFKDETGRTALHWASMQNHMEVVVLLLYFRALVDEADAFGNTPLHLASSYGTLKIVKALLAHGASVTAINSSGYSPLHEASYSGHFLVVEELLAHGAVPNLAGEKGKTALHLASESSHLETLKLLLNARANFNFKDANGKSASDLGDDTVRALFRLYQPDVTPRTLPQTITITKDIHNSGPSTPFLALSGIKSPSLSAYSIQSAIWFINEALNFTRQKPTVFFEIVSTILSLSLDIWVHPGSVLTTGLMTERIIRDVKLNGPLPQSQTLVSVLEEVRNFFEVIVFEIQPVLLRPDDTERQIIEQDVAAKLSHLQDRLTEAVDPFKIHVSVQVEINIDELNKVEAIKSQTIQKMDKISSFNLASSKLNVNIIETMRTIDITLSPNIGHMIEKMRSLDEKLKSIVATPEIKRQEDALAGLMIQLQRGLEYYENQVALKNITTDHSFKCLLNESKGKINDTVAVIRHAHDVPESFCVDNIESWMLSSDDIVFDPSKTSTILGCGGFGLVMKGMYHGREVAVKQFHEILATDSADLEKCIAKEIKAWKTISHEPYILTLYGVCTKVPTPILVSELCQTNIRRYIRSNPAMLLPMIYQFACGLATIHKAGIIHRDLKGDNVLVTFQNTVAIADFGLSRTAMSLEKTTIGSTGMGTLNWMSPEQYLRPRRATTKSDIWSFGMTVWEILCNDTPFRGCTRFEFENEIFQSESDRPEKPQDLDSQYEPLWTLMTNCWQLNPIARPSAVEIVEFVNIHYGCLLE